MNPKESQTIQTSQDLSENPVESDSNINDCIGPIKETKVWPTIVLEVRVKAPDAETALAALRLKHPDYKGKTVAWTKEINYPTAIRIPGYINCVGNFRAAPKNSSTQA